MGSFWGVRSLGAIRDRILVPENIAYAVERAIEIVREESEAKDTTVAEARLSEIGTQIDRLIKLAETAGDIEAIGARLAQLERERESLADQVVSRLEPPNLDALRPAIEQTVRSFSEWLSGTPEQGKRALRSLLGDRRMTVAADAERQLLFGMFSEYGSSRT